MFGEPITVIAPLLRVLREIDGVSERERRVAALHDRRKVENGAEDHNSKL